MFTFARVIEAGSFTGAGKLLGLPTSTVSRRVARLEDQLGVRLLQRTTRALHLTDAGRVYHVRAAALLLDFEEAERAPYTMPFDFYRFIAPDKGFPRFGTMQLSRTAAHEGRWSFMFELDGGSLSARLPTAVIPVLPGGDYRVSAWVRTEHLDRATAQIVAQLYDADHRPIAESRATSPPLRTAGRWQHVSIDVYGDSDAAADLVLELQVLQPRLHSGRREGQPQLDDLAGRAWFDDIAVWQQPRIELSTSAPDNVIVEQAVPLLHVLVRDPTAEDLTARLLVLDLDGRVVREQRHALARGSWRHTLKLDGIDDGWYRAVVEVRNDDRIVGRRTLDLVVLRTQRASHNLDQRLGVVLGSPATPASTDMLRRLVKHLGVTGVMLPVPRQSAALSPDGGRSPMHRAGQEMLDRGVELTIALPGLSRDLTHQGPLDRDRVRALIKGRDDLTDLFMGFGLEVPRWLLTPGIDQTPGPAAVGSAVLLSDEQLQTMVDSVAGALADFVPDPVVLVPWSAEYELAPLPAPHGYWIDIPTFIAPRVLADFAAQWPIGTQPVHTTIQRLDADLYAPDQRVEDLLLRTLWGFRAGLPHMAITAPWSRRGPRGPLVPDPSFPVWRALADRLDGRRFSGVLPVADGVQCWILSGPGPGETTLVAWNEKALPASAALSMLLADGPVDVVDAFGNRREVAPTGGVHEIPLRRRPLFVEGVDAGLVGFRAAFRIMPDYLPARHQVHEGDVLLGNPWGSTITGTIRLRPPAGWRITPRIHRFSIPPGGQAKLPVSIVFTQRLITGVSFAEADVELTADREYRFRVRARLEVGVRDLEFTAHWHRALDRAGSGDLIITETVTNTGNRTVNLTAYVSAPGLSRQRRRIGDLGPGQTAVRSFRLADGERLLSGRRVHLGVITQDGARLNRVLEIPVLVDAQ